MKVLLLDTCGNVGTVALADTAEAAPVLQVVEMAGRTASERLVAVVREAMVRERWDLRELELLVVVAGPGSFTGVRVGLSAVKGLSEATGRPVVGVSRLALLAAGGAAGWTAKGVGAAGSEQEIVAVLDAGRGEFYCGRYVGETCVGEALVGRDEAVALIGRAAGAVACEVGVVEALTPVLGAGVVKLVAEPTAGDALPMAMRRVAEGSFDDVAKLDANYLRRTDGEIFAKPSRVRPGTTAL
jgi:tRNA threonylcarbamoyladenosine biosynthesis protein TsaB